MRQEEAGPGLLVQVSYSPSVMTEEALFKPCVRAKTSRLLFSADISLSRCVALCEMSGCALCPFHTFVLEALLKLSGPVRSWLQLVPVGVSKGQRSVATGTRGLVNDSENDERVLVRTLTRNYVS